MLNKSRCILFYFITVCCILFYYCILYISTYIYIYNIFSEIFCDTTHPPHRHRWKINTLLKELLYATAENTLSFITRSKNGLCFLRCDAHGYFFTFFILHSSTTPFIIFIISSLFGRSIFIVNFDKNFSRVINYEKIFLNERIRDLKYDAKNKLILLALEENGELGILSLK